MSKRTLARLSRAAVLVLVAVTIVFGVVALPEVQATSYEASSITKRDDIKVDYTPYLDSSVMYPLPEGVGDDEDISVIITVDVPNLMDAYEQTDKTMSFAEYALQSEEAAQLEGQMMQQKK